MGSFCCLNDKSLSGRRLRYEVPMSVKDYERLPETVRGAHLIAFGGFMVKHAAALVHDSV